MLSLLEDGSRVGFRNAMFYLKLGDGQIPKKEKIMSLNLEGMCKSNTKGYAGNRKETTLFVG